MSEYDKAVYRVANWISAGDSAEARHGYHDAGRLPIENDIKIIMAKMTVMKETLERAEDVLEGIVTIRREGDILDAIKSALNA